MSSLTAGYSFLLEFSESGVNKIIQALFTSTEGGVETLFRHNDKGQPGLLTSRDSVSGRLTYQRYLLEGLIGYELSLHDPYISLLGGSRQQVELTIAFDFTLFRQLMIRSTSDQLHIPADPETIDPNQDYDVVFDSDTHPPDAPGVRGRLVIVLNLANTQFGTGNRVTIDASRSDLSLVEKVEIENVDWPLGFEDFVETVTAKSIVTVLSNEIREIDVTSQFGNFNAFGVTLREPIHLRIGKSELQTSLAVGMHEWSLVDDGRPLEIGHHVQACDYATQIDEGFFHLLIMQLQNGSVIPHKYNATGDANQDGEILLHNIRISFELERIRVQILVSLGNFTDLFAETFVRVSSDANGILQFRLEDTRVHPQLGGYLGAVQRLFNTLAFYIFDSLVADILGDLWEAVVDRTVGDTLEEFLERGAMGFAFKSPIRNTEFIAVLLMKEFEVEPGRAILRGDIGIEEASDAG